MFAFIGFCLNHHQVRSGNANTWNKKIKMDKTPRGCSSFNLDKKLLPERSIREYNDINEVPAKMEARPVKREILFLQMKRV